MKATDVDNEKNLLKIRNSLLNNQNSRYTIGSCAIWLWNMVSYIKGGMQAKSIWKQDPEANI